MTNNNKYKILVVEDDNNIRNLLTILFKENSYQTISADTCQRAMMLYSSYRPDLIILNLGLPDMDGTVLLNEVRKNSHTPIIILSSRNNESDIVNALNMGANDYVTKPFGTEELLARVRAVLRMATHRNDEGRLPDGRFVVKNFTINYNSRRVFIDDNEIKLTQTEFNILALLSEHTGKVLPYSYIIKTLWGLNDSNSIKKLQVNISNIRKKINEKTEEIRYIVNEPGVGYRICEDNDW